VAGELAPVIEAARLGNAPRGPPRAEEPTYAMWWIPAGTVPTVDDARGRLALLRAHGATAHAFTLTALLPVPGRHAGG
jgi:hypothetical protein